MIHILSFIFFLSGTAGLIFETLWFRMAGLTFGNSVWASGLVLSSFMGGLALGNALAIKYASLLRRPLFFYAIFEVIVGVVGIGLVFSSPFLPELFAPLFEPLLDKPLLLNPLRLGLAFVLLMLPTTAMGLTLPVMVKALHRWKPGFGQALGRLYGWNTIGAMVGAIACEEVLIGFWGIRGTALAAAALNGVAAFSALAISRAHERSDRIEPEPARPAAEVLPTHARRWLLVAFASGAALLALEVVWFRFLQLFVISSSRVFAWMLLVVLLGIGCGGLVSAVWLRYQRNAYRLFPLLAFAAGVLVLWTYTGFVGAPVSNRESILGHIPETFWLSFRLMFPVSFLSGILFTFNGRSVYDSIGEETRTVGWVTLSNTIGAMLGAILAAWWLLPKLGVENSIFALALLYAAIAIAAPKLSREEASPRVRLAFIVAAVAMLGSAAFYPFGLMRNHFVPLVTSTYATANTSVLGYREGLTETIIYTQDHWLGEPYYNRMLTNAYSMSSTDLLARRYMKHFVFWPLAFHPKVEDALLISYGVGSTAKALTESKEIGRIDIVDISRDVLETNSFIFPNQEESPLQDPRVTVFIEDGRFFLLTSRQEYDLITGEPPPLMMNGVVNLYTQEYFELLRGRLKEGGYTTYWLPVEQLSESDSKAVIAGFCNVFEDCSLWRGAGLQLVLVGSKNATAKIEESRFKRQWKDQAVVEELRVLGFETPELLLTTFVGDTSYLRSLTKDAAPLVDNYPHRLSRQLTMNLDFHYGMVANDKAAERYRESGYLKNLLPPALFEAGLSNYRYQAPIDECLNAYPNPRPIPLTELHMILTETDLRTPALWLLGDTAEFSGIVEHLSTSRGDDLTVELHLGLRGFAARNYQGADRHFQRAQQLGDEGQALYYYRILALAYAGDLEAAQSVVTELAGKFGAVQSGESVFWDFVSKNFGLLAPSL